MTAGNRTALDAPRGDFVELTRELARQATDYAARSPRQRVIQPLHTDHEELLHRMLNAAQPGTYVRPHRHLTPPKAEAFVVLQGAADLLLFADDGQLMHVSPLRAGSELFGIDIRPGPFHCFVIREPDTVLYEVKAGPYVPSSDKDFAGWAPAECAEEATSYLRALEHRASAWLASR